MTYIIFGGLAIGVLALLLRQNERMTARMIAGTGGDAAARPGGAVAAWGHPGAGMRPYRSEAALGPVLWRDDGELLPAIPEPPTVRIGGRPEPEPAAASSETWTPQRTPSIEADVAVPGLQAVLTAGAAAICAGLLAWALGWSWRVPVVVGALTLAGSWLWRLGVVDRLLWTVESFTGKDVDGDGVTGRPQVSFTLANPGQARQTVAKEVRAAAASAEQAELLQFVDACFMRGTAEGRHGVTAAGPDRTAYLAKRDALLNLGVARWKNPARPRAGWCMACSRQRARQLVTKHVL